MKAKRRKDYKRYPKRCSRIKVNHTKLDITISKEEFDELMKTIDFKVEKDIAVATIRSEGVHSFMKEYYDIVITHEKVDEKVRITSIDFPQRIYTERDVLSFLVMLKKLVCSCGGELLLDLYDKPRVIIEHYKDGQRLHTRKAAVYYEDDFAEHVLDLIEKHKDNLGEEFENALKEMVVER